MTNELPLFPLNTVLFPGAPLPLHIFEERYRLMIGRCIADQTPFGVVLILEDDRTDTEPDVTFHRVGTAAVISEGVRLEDGRYYLVATGERRFTVEQVLRREPYVVASVAYLPPEEPPTAEMPEHELRDLYRRYWLALAAATGFQHDREQLPGDPVELSHWLSHRLQVENARKQHWLETDVVTRLTEMSAALRAELALLPKPNAPRPPQSWTGPGSWN